MWGLPCQFYQTGQSSQNPALPLTAIVKVTENRELSPLDWFSPPPPDHIIRCMVQLTIMNISLVMEPTTHPFLLLVSNAMCCVLNHFYISNYCHVQQIPPRMPQCNEQTTFFDIKILPAFRGLCSAECRPPSRGLPPNSTGSRASKAYIALPL